jgi:hypothetical protein
MDPTRRSFIKRTLGAAAAISAAPAILTKGNTMAANPILGAGRHTYELVPGWAKVPDNIKLGFTHGVCVDSQNRVYIFSQSTNEKVNAMCVFDEDGKFIKTWNCDFEKGAHGLTLVKEGSDEFLWLCDYAPPARVMKCTLDGEVLLTLKHPPMPEVYPEVKNYIPTNAAPIPGGDVYVADGYGRSWIHQYSNKGEYIRSFGGKQEAKGEHDVPGKFNCPHGIAIDTRGEKPVVLVADRANVRLQTLDLEGNPIAQFGRENLRHPCHFDQLPNGDLLIPDLHGRVTIFDKENQLVAHLGDNPGVEKVQGYPNLAKETWDPAKFISPHSACWDKRGDLIVVEWIRIGRITKLRRVNV